MLALKSTDQLAPSSPLNVLLVEDSAADAQLLVRRLQASAYELQYERVDTAASLQAALGRRAWDVILCDHAMQAFDAAAALRLYQAQALDIPFIIVSGEINVNLAVALMKAGAHDFVRKDDLARLAPAVERELREARVRRARRQAESALRQVEGRLHTVIAHAPLIVFALDDAGRFTLCQGRELAALGAFPTDVVGQSVVSVLPDAPDFHAALARVGSRTTQAATLALAGRLYDVQLSPLTDEAGQVAGVIGVATDVTDRHRAEAQLRENARRAELLAAFAQALAAAHREPETILELAARWTAEALNGWGVAAQIALDSGARPMAVAAQGEARGAARIHRWDELAEQLVWAAASHPDQAVNAGQVAAPWLSAVAPELGAAAPGGAALLALRAPGDWAGALLALRAPGTAGFSPADLAWLQSLAERTALALDNARLYRDAQRRWEHVRALRAIDQAIASNAGSAAMLEVILSKTLAQLHVDAAAAFRYDALAEALYCLGALGMRHPLSPDQGIALAVDLAGQTIHTGRPVLRPVLHADAVNYGRLAIENAESYYAVPLIARGRAIGVLEVLHRSRLAADAEWLHVLETLAGQAAIALDQASMLAELQLSHAELTRAYDSTIEGWSRALEFRDHETQGHSRRVTALTLQLAAAMGLPAADLVHIRRGALLHDIGKMAVPDAILRKPGPLTAEEWAVMREHPVRAHELLQPIGYLQPALVIPYYHHERWDGSGYPLGLTGEAIPLAARIFALVDVWDALSQNRPYRRALPPAMVREYIRGQAGRQFDPAVVAAWLALERDGLADAGMWK